MIRLLLMLMVCFAFPLQAAWLGLCDGHPQPALPNDFSFNTADGAVKTLRLAENDPPESCVKTALPVSADAIQWFALLSAGQALQIGLSNFVVLQGQQNGKHFAGEIILNNGIAAPATPLLWPLYLDLQGHLDIMLFGLEERASLERSGTNLTFRCLAGQRPAGFVVPVGQNLLPQLPGLGLDLTIRGNGDFTWNASQSGNNQDPQPLATLQANNQWRTEHIDLAPMLDPHNLKDSWVLLCPQTSASLTLSAMQLTAPTKAAHGRATWLWREASWRQADKALWEQLGKTGITTVYITIPLSPDLTQVADIKALQAFISQADKQGVAVWAVAGDPQAVLASERKSWLKRAQAYAAYNRDAAKSAQIKGVQYDIEPYLAPGFAQAPEIWKQAYIDTLAALRNASPLAVEAAVPVWWAQETLKDKPLLEAMAAVVDSLTVMDYRTEPWRIQQQALPFLAWGAHHNKPVRIALEAGAVGEESRLAFHRADTGELWAVHVGDYALLVRLATSSPNSNGATFVQRNEATISGAAVSYHGRLDEMAGHLPQLEQALGAWPTFIGLALHEVLPP